MKGYLVIPVTIIICISIMVANGELFEIVETRIVSTRIIDTINDVTVTSCIIQCQGYKDCVTIGFRKQPNVVMLLSSCYFLKEEQAIKKDTAGEAFVNVFVLKKIGTETLAVLSNLKSTSEPSTTATSPTTTKSSGVSYIFYPGHRDEMALLDIGPGPVRRRRGQKIIQRWRIFTAPNYFGAV